MGGVRADDTGIFGASTVVSLELFPLPVAFPPVAYEDDVPPVAVAFPPADVEEDVELPPFAVCD